MVGRRCVDRRSYARLGAGLLTVGQFLMVLVAGYCYSGYSVEGYPISSFASVRSASLTTVAGHANRDGRRTFIRAHSSPDTETTPPKKRAFVDKFEVHEEEVAFSQQRQIPSAKEKKTLTYETVRLRRLQAREHKLSNLELESQRIRDKESSAENGLTDGQTRQLHSNSVKEASLYTEIASLEREIREGSKRGRGATPAVTASATKKSLKKKNRNAQSKGKKRNSVSSQDKDESDDEPLTQTQAVTKIQDSAMKNSAQQIPSAKGKKTGKKGAVTASATKKSTSKNNNGSGVQSKGKKQNGVSSQDKDETKSQDSAKKLATPKKSKKAQPKGKKRNVISSDEDESDELVNEGASKSRASSAKGTMAHKKVAASTRAAGNKKSKANGNSQKKNQRKNSSKVDNDEKSDPANKSSKTRVSEGRKKPPSTTTNQSPANTKTAKKTPKRKQSPSNSRTKSESLKSRFIISSAQKDSKDEDEPIEKSDIRGSRKASDPDTETTLPSSNPNHNADANANAYARHWEHLLRVEQQERAEQAKQRRSDWSPRRLQDTGYDIRNALAMCDTELLGDKMVKVLIPGYSHVEEEEEMQPRRKTKGKRKTPLRELFSRGDVYALTPEDDGITALGGEMGRFIAKRRQQTPLNKRAAVLPREVCVMDVDHHSVTVGCGPTWPHNLWGSRKEGMRVRLVKVEPQTPLLAQLRALHAARNDDAGMAAGVLVRSFDSSKAGDLEEVASRFPGRFSNGTALVPTSSERGSPLEEKSLEEAIEQAMDSTLESVSRVNRKRKRSVTDPPFLPNRSQRDAITWALQRTVSLIQGPPGTGKTRLAALLIAAALQLHSPSTITSSRPPRILAVTHSNGAADVLLSSLLSLQIPAVRGGRPASISPDVQHRSVSALAEHHPEVKDLRDQSCDASLSVPERDAALRDARICASKVAESMMRDLAPVVVTSCIGAHQLLKQSEDDDDDGSNTNGMDHSKQPLFDLVVNDEAAQTTEPSLLVALASSRAEQIIMVGDTKQLPPTVTSQNVELREALGTSPMLRLEHLGVGKQMLNMQYRMKHEALLQFPSRYFYGGKVVSPPSPLPVKNDEMPATELPEGFPWPNDDIPLCFINVHKTGKNNNQDFRNNGTFSFGVDSVELEMTHDYGGKSNPTEAKLAAMIVNIFLLEQSTMRTKTHASKINNNGENSLQNERETSSDEHSKSNIYKTNNNRVSTVAVITPYARQVALLREEISRTSSSSVHNHASNSEGPRVPKKPKIQVGTIDSFQGQETDMVLLSIVRSNPMGDLGFVRDPRRLCVALTRAKKGLIVLGDAKTLRKCPSWRALIDSCMERDCFVEDMDMAWDWLKMRRKNAAFVLDRNADAVIRPFVTTNATVTNSDLDSSQNNVTSSDNILNALSQTRDFHF